MSVADNECGESLGRAKSWCLTPASTGVNRWSRCAWYDTALLTLPVGFALFVVSIFRVSCRSCCCLWNLAWWGMVWRWCLFDGCSCKGAILLLAGCRGVVALLGRLCRSLADGRWRAWWLGCFPFMRVAVCRWRVCCVVKLYYYCFLAWR